MLAEVLSERGLDGLLRIGYEIFFFQMRLKPFVLLEIF